ncbi:MAG TPA: GNAT family N-acetyltransferase [Dongiaceae bacterium]|nr:GNAT family N-acetyltransferase [Dongiaceae bacterium]
MIAASPIHIRPARRSDVPGIVALLADDAIGQGRERPESIERYFAAYDALASDPAVRCLVAADEEDAVTGYVQVTITRHLSFGGARRALVEDLRVAPAHRRNGLGTRLVEAAIAAALSAGCDIVQLFVHRDREAAHCFYRKLGFQIDHLGLRLSLK